MLLCRIDQSKTGMTSRHFVSSMSSRRSCRDNTNARLLELTWSVQATSDDDVPGPSTAVRGETFKCDRFLRANKQCCVKGSSARRRRPRNDDEEFLVDERDDTEMDTIEGDEESEETTTRSTSGVAAATGSRGRRRSRTSVAGSGKGQRAEQRRQLDAQSARAVELDAENGWRTVHQPTCVWEFEISSPDPQNSSGTMKGLCRKVSCSDGILIM